jgi:acyl-coenzyme A synthetase/AMP-(fatty) acid ligase
VDLCVHLALAHADLVVLVLVVLAVPALVAQVADQVVLVVRVLVVLVVVSVVLVLVALVVLKPGASIDAARVHGQDRLVPSMQPMFWLAVSTLPRNPAGKLLRSQLAQMVRAEPTRHGDV